MNPVIIALGAGQKLTVLKNVAAPGTARVSVALFGAELASAVLTTEQCEALARGLLACAGETA